MFFHAIHLLPVFIAAVLGLALGAAWYAPFLFGKKYVEGMKLDGAGAKPKSMLVNQPIAFVFLFIAAYVLAALFNSLVIVGGLGAMLFVPFLMWVAFVVPIALNDYLWGNKPLSLVLINTGYFLAALLVMSLVVGVY